MRLYNWPSTVSARWFHPLVLLVWFIIGLGLRFTNLTAKPPWTDEFATLVFSLGNSFLPVPLDQAIAPDILLQSLQPNLASGVGDVIHHLMTEDNHPPLYFVLVHLWMKLFPNEGELVSLFAARSFPALLGAVLIPLSYILGNLAFRSTLVAQLAAAMMAASPYAVYLGQEARHYTLAMIWVIASLSCLVIATRHIQNRTPLSLWVIISWVGVNGLGIATHYFFVLTLCAEALVLIFLAWQQSTQAKTLVFFSSVWWRIYAVAIGTAISCLVWLPGFLQNRYRSSLTEWIRSDRVGLEWLNPIFQAFAAWVTMIMLLPVESPQLAIVIVSGLGMLMFAIWATPILLRGWKFQLYQPQTNLETQVFTGVILGAIALFFILSYIFGIDITRGARYNFVYFPAVIILVGASLAPCWQTSKKAVTIIWLMGLVSAVTVICNLGYQKYYRPDLLLPIIQQNSQVPVLIATTHKTLVQTGEMMGIARELKFSDLQTTTQFLLAHQEKDPNTSTITLENTLKQLPRPLDLWLVNFYAPIPVEVNKCLPESQSSAAVNGYEYKIYHCL
ncbi:glycosyltransferase family 39 protein [Anabaena subtropica]|uniref:Glycosyltransferase family 39 protein n=1 Tax=Anabaena subtropica FACHB-260 TaxID=2692884 RepID=A0ABR8CU15_9NOST|nr:glycosyltransferase family 39 protein [Anabaena subtropica]MBD2346682.1 glycosyltransferase family 39 protein [Anabaena subtropica FACHB-260]